MDTALIMSAAPVGTVANVKLMRWICYGSSYELFGRQHNLMFGGSYSKQNNRYFSSWANIFPDEIGSFYNFISNFLTDWSPQAAPGRAAHMKSLYAATRVTLADPLHLILGALYQLAG